jgi:hypothetical protein
MIFEDAHWADGLCESPIQKVAWGDERRAVSGSVGRCGGNVRVQARIAEIMRAGAERAEVTVEQVVRELKLIGFSDIRKVVSWRNELVTRTEKGEDGAPVLMPRVTIVDADRSATRRPPRLPKSGRR